METVLRRHSRYLRQQRRAEGNWRRRPIDFDTVQRHHLSALIAGGGTGRRRRADRGPPDGGINGAPGSEGSITIQGSIQTSQGSAATAGTTTQGPWRIRLLLQASLGLHLPRSRVHPPRGWRPGGRNVGGAVGGRRRFDRAPDGRRQPRGRHLRRPHLDPRIDPGARWHGLGLPRFPRRIGRIRES